MHRQVMINFCLHYIEAVEIVKETFDTYRVPSSLLEDEILTPEVKKNICGLWGIGWMPTNVEYYPFTFRIVFFEVWSRVLLHPEKDKIKRMWNNKMYKSRMYSKDVMDILLGSLS